MTDRAKITARVASVILALVGLFVLLQSTQMGINGSNVLLQKQGGGMETSMFIAVRQAAMETYRLIGAILLGVGAFCALHT